MLCLANLSYSINGRPLLKNASLTIQEGQRVGLIGANGTGKTTLFRLITGEISPDAGHITRRKGSTLGIVRQDLPEDETKVIDIVLAADKERENLLSRATELETSHILPDPHEIAAIYTRLEQIGAYDAPSRAATILAGLGFSQEAQHQPISSFSGGWRMRVALASVLFWKSDLLLLDEPTNHLDFESILWLENYLSRYEGTLILISHDRDILNKTANTIVHLENTSLTSYTGNYDQFETRRAQQQMSQQALHEKQTAQKTKMMAFVERFRAKASKAKQAQSRLKMIEKLDIVDAVLSSEAPPFPFHASNALPSPIITLEEVLAGYSPDTPILKGLNLSISADDRIALLGANGNGKSTLIKLLSGKLSPFKGKFHQLAKLKIGYFAQHQSEELNLRETPCQAMTSLMLSAAETANETRVRSELGKFGFDKIRADTPIGQLSGGERSRLLLCLLSYHKPHLLLLDEPTNHLDIAARQALIEGLNQFQGAIILVSHDTHFIQSVADSLWIIEGGRCTPFAEDIESYRQLVLTQRRSNKNQTEEKAKSKEREPQVAKKRPPSKKLLLLEQHIAQLHQEKDLLELQVEGIAAKNDYLQLKALNEQLQKLNNEILAAEEQWLELQM
jgi:ATP-binding cassette subfamily F protein 3